MSSEDTSETSEEEQQTPVLPQRTEGLAGDLNSLIHPQDNVENLPFEPDRSSPSFNLGDLNFGVLLSESDIGTAQSPTQAQSRFQRYFGVSSPTDSQQGTGAPELPVSPIQAYDYGADSFAQGRGAQDSGSFTDLNWLQSLLSQTGQGLWSEPTSTSPPPGDWSQDFFSQSVPTFEQQPQWNEPSDQNEGGVDTYPQSSGIEEDISIMRSKGFYMQQNSRSGTLLTGSFGPEITSWTDVKSRPFGEYEVGEPVVAKFNEFTDDIRSETHREMFDIERFILTYVEHPNVVSIRYVFNFGHKTESKYRNNPYATFPSWDREYLIVEFADLGDLETYLDRLPDQNTLTERVCVSIIQQLYSGLKHLHDLYVFHTDIEARNILLFSGRASNIQVKWCDFSMSCILNGSHPSHQIPINAERITLHRNHDFSGLAKVFTQIVWMSASGPEVRQSVERIAIFMESGDLEHVDQMVDFLTPI